MMFVRLHRQKDTQFILINITTQNSMQGIGCHQLTILHNFDNSE